MRNKKKESPIRFLLRRNGYLGLLTTVCAFFALPFWAICTLPRYVENFAQHMEASGGVLTAERRRAVMNLLRTMTYGPGNLEIASFFYAGIGFLCAMVLFMHLFSRRRAMMIGALPVRRRDDFRHRGMCFYALGLLPVALCIALYLALVACSGLSTAADIGVLAAQGGAILLTTVYGYALGCLCCALTGQFWAAVLAALVIGASPEALLALWQQIARVFLYTMPKNAIVSLLKRVSPAVTLYKSLYQPETSVVWPGLLAIVVYLTAAHWLYERRGAEAAGRTLAFPRIGDALSVYVSLVGGTVVGYIFLMLFDREAALIGALAGGAFVSYVLCRLLLTMEFRGVLRKLYLPVLSAAALVLMVGALHFDVLGYDRYLPKREKLTAITYSAYQMNGSETIRLEDQETLDAAWRWAKLLRDFSDDEPDGMHSLENWYMYNICMEYDVGGRKVRRVYRRDDRAAAQADIRTIVESDAYRAQMIEDDALRLLLRQDEGNLYVMASVGYGYGSTIQDLAQKIGLADHYNYTVRPKKYAELYEALCKDLSARTLEDMQSSGIGMLVITGQNAQGEWTERAITLHPGDVHTLTMLFGDQAEALDQKLMEEIVEDERYAVCKATYRTENPYDWRKWSDLETLVEATSPEEAKRWLEMSMSSDDFQNYYSKERNGYINILVFDRELTAHMAKEEMGLEMPTDGGFAEFMMTSGILEAQGYNLTVIRRTPYVR